MPTFSFAAFLKIASLNPKPQRTELRRRLLGGSGQPYDFHRSLKLAGKKLVVDRIPLDELLSSAKDVVQVPERMSLIAGLTKLGAWCDGVPTASFKVPPKVYESPNGLFKISSQPEFGLIGPNGRIAFHLWNTKTPDLKPDAVYGMLGLLPDLYVKATPTIADFGLLSLHEPKAYRLSDVSSSTDIAAKMVAGIESVISDIYDEYGPPPPSPDKRPPGP
jgi:hypothetical protein